MFGTWFHLDTAFDTGQLAPEWSLNRTIGSSCPLFCQNDTGYRHSYSVRAWP